MMPRRTVRIAVTLALATSAGACSTGAPAVEPPEVAGFERGELIDVLEPDAIPAIRVPEFSSIDDATSWLTDDGPVVVVEVAGEARAYPLAILVWHEIVNDEIAGRKIAVTYCPLCNSAVVYEREVGAPVLTFITSGKLYRSDLVMLDLQTKSLWLQITGTAVLGPLKGATLDPIPSTVASFGEYRATFPEGRVLLRPQGRTYGTTPYPGYDGRAGPIEDLFSAGVDQRLPPMTRVVGVAVGRAARAYPAVGMSGEPTVIHDRIGETDVVIFGTGDQRSALDEVSIADGARVGSAGVFSPGAGRSALRFAVEDGEIRDEQTGSRWSIFGRAVEGPSAGRQLEPIHHIDAFWFAWAAFVPFTDVWAG